MLGVDTLQQVIGSVFGETSERSRASAGESADSASVALDSDVDRTEWSTFDGDIADTEVLGGVVMAYIAAASGVSSLFEKQTQTELAKRGIDDISPEEWYSLPATLATVYSLREQYGDDCIQTMGRHIPENADLPPVDSVRESIATVEGGYQNHHRGGEFGSYSFEPKDEGEGVVVSDHPYPCELDKGLLRGFGERAGSAVSVEEVGDECRREGGDTCTYRVEWAETSE